MSTFNDKFFLQKKSENKKSLGLDKAFLDDPIGWYRDIMIL